MAGRIAVSGAKGGRMETGSILVETASRSLDCGAMVSRLSIGPGRQSLEVAAAQGGRTELRDLGCIVVIFQRPGAVFQTKGKHESENVGPCECSMAAWPCGSKGRNSCSAASRGPAGSVLK